MGAAELPLAAGGVFALSLLLKATLILGAAWLLSMSARRSSAAVRHGVWIAALTAVVALPVADRWLPPLEVQVPALLRTLPTPEPSPALPATTRGAAAEATASTGGMPVPTFAPASGAPAPGETRGSGRPFDWPLLLVLVWLGGIAVRGLWLGSQLVRVRRLIAGSHTIDGERCAAACTAARSLGVRRPVLLLESARVATPVTCGIVRPVILLPEESVDWAPERLRVVLLHELAHIRRWDYLCCVLAELVCAAYWPVPLVWVARSAIQAEQEQASDDLVLAAGASPVDYADHLLAIARSLRQGGPAPHAAIGMAREVGLKRRIRTILDSRTPRVPLASTHGAATLLALLLCAVPLAALRPTEEEPEFPAERLDSATAPADTPEGDTVAQTGSPPAADLYLWLEAELGILRGRIARGEDLDASEGHYVEVDADDRPGEALLSLHLPRAGEYRVWARSREIRDEATLTLAVGDSGIVRRAVLDDRGEDEDWRWVPFDGSAGQPLTLSAGVHALRLGVENGEARIDRVLLTTDGGYVPSSRGAEPEGYSPLFRWIDVGAGPLEEPLEVEVELPAAGQYVLWGRVMARDEDANSFYLSVDGGPEVVWDAPRRELGREEGRWVWDPASAREIDGRPVNPLILELAAGRHTVRLRPREVGTGIAGLLVTNDLSYRPSGRPAGSPPVQLWLEPERASRGEALRVRQGRGAMGDGYLEASERGPERSDPDDHDPVALSFELPAAGVYTLWGRTVAPGDDENSFWIRVNGGRWVRWNDIPRSRGWRWSAVHDGDGGARPVQLTLPAGENRIEIARREGGVRLDRLLLTNDEFVEPQPAAAE